MQNEIIIGDCQEVLPSFPDNTFDLAILDPPYYKIKTDSWDRQWKTFSEYLDWLEGVCLEVKRVLKDNGSLYVFGDDRNIAYVQVRLDKHFTFLNHLIWYKRNNLPIKFAHNHLKFCPVSERILFYGLQDQTGLQFVEKEYVAPKNPFAKELREARKTANLSINEVAEYGKFYGNVNHGGAVTNWERGYNIPSKEQWAKMCELLPTLNENYEDLRREYEDLRREYEDLRRPFHYLPQMYEVFDIPIIGGKENTAHPTTKPKELYKRIIQCSTNEGALILDPFAGSGTSLIAAKETGRYCIAIEKEEKYLPIIQERGQLNTVGLEGFV